MNYKEKSRQIINYNVIRRYQNGRILLGQNDKSGLLGYDNTSPDYNRVLLYPTGHYKQHSYCSQINLGNIWFEKKEYEFAGEY